MPLIIHGKPDLMGRAWNRCAQGSSILMLFEPDCSSLDLFDFSGPYDGFRSIGNDLWTVLFDAVSHETNEEALDTFLEHIERQFEDCQIERSSESTQQVRI